MVTADAAEAPSTMAVKGVILVGGPSLSTSFRPLNLNVPKPLFPIAGHPIIYHHIRALKQVPQLSQILLIGTFEPSQFTEFIANASKELDVSIK
jgi:mannose-1-phosphate guanylyltransferase